MKFQEDCQKKRDKKELDFIQENARQWRQSKTTEGLTYTCYIRHDEAYGKI